MAREMTISDNDKVLIAAGVLFGLIVLASAICFFIPASLTAYTAIVTNTLLPLFTTVVGIKVAYVFGAYLLSKFSNK
jgi:hypothetical protein